MTLFVQFLFAMCLAVLSFVDRLLARVAYIFGAEIPDPFKRYFTLLCVFAGIFLVGLLPVPWLPLIALLLGYLGIVSIAWTWANNEKHRGEIVKKLSDDKPDSLPDLRLTALISILMFIPLFPIAYQQVYNHFGGFQSPANATLWNWFLFSIDSYNKALFGALELCGISFDTIQPKSTLASFLVFVQCFTFDYLLVAGLIRLYEIRQRTVEAIQALPKDRNFAERVGQRAVTWLIPLLRDPNPIVCRNAAESLGAIGDRRAFIPLMEILNDPTSKVKLLRAALLGLGPLNDSRGFDKYRLLLDHQSPLIRKPALIALLNLDDPRVSEVVEEVLLKHPEMLDVVIINDPRPQDFDFLVKNLDDNKGTVRAASAERLGILNDARAFEPLVKRLGIETHFSALPNIINALTEIGDLRAIDPIAKVLHNGNVQIKSRCAAATSLGKFGTEAAVLHLVDCLKKSIGKVEEDLRGTICLALSRMCEIGHTELVRQHALSTLFDRITNFVPREQAHAATCLAYIENMSEFQCLQGLVENLENQNNPDEWLLGRLKEARDRLELRL